MDLTVTVCIASFEAIGEFQRKRLCQSRATHYLARRTNTWSKVPLSVLGHHPHRTRSVVDIFRTGEVGNVLQRLVHSQEHWPCPSTVVWAPIVPPVPQWNERLVLPQPKPGPQFNILLGPRLSAKWRKKDVLIASDSWWNLNLGSFDWQWITRPHSQSSASTTQSTTPTLTIFCVYCTGGHLNASVAHLASTLAYSHNIKLIFASS